MSDVSISYKGAEIASLDDSGMKTLLTSGKYCEDDIEVAYTKPSGGDPYDIARKLVMNTLTAYEDDLTTIAAAYAFSNKRALTSVKIHNCTHLGTEVFSGAGVAPPIPALAFPKLTSFSNYALRNCKATVLDFGPTFHANIMDYLFNGASANVLIFRYDGIVPLVNIAKSMPPAFLSNGGGGTIYIPKSMYDHLGDGSALDYKAATNWVTLDGYGKTTWAQIEGSVYEMQYADGTPIS